MTAAPILETTDLRKYFPITKGLAFSRVRGWIKAVDGVNFDISPGETFSLVGESGCGKTTTARIILRLEPPTSGAVRFRGQDIYALSGEELKAYRSSVQAVFQDPWSSMNPRMRIGPMVAEPLKYSSTMSPGDMKSRVAELLEQVGLEPAQANLYPHEFSGGQRQRIAVARALALKPSLVVLDEPVSALDVSIRAQIMNLLKDLQGQYGLSYLLIAHHLATVRYMSHRIAVMYVGKIVEMAETEELFSRPVHPYTQALISAALPARPGVERAEIILRGTVPSPVDLPPGCRFHPRCPQAHVRCSQGEPELREVSPGHYVCCDHC
ncbi:MAG: ABC transporter ATP-binding protein [Chloroflexi bacterium]|nr:ABC transporter ATP-binding protein [Chloroflexota bacterium]